MGAQALYTISDRTLTEICRTACVSLVAREMEDAATQTMKRGASQFMPGTEADAAAPTYAAFTAQQHAPQTDSAARERGVSLT